MILSFFQKIGELTPALKHRNFRLFFMGQCISTIGTWMQTIAQSWLVLQLTGSDLKLGIVSAMQFLPMMMFSLFGGTFADMFPKHKILIITQTSLAVQACLLAVLTYSGVAQYWMVLVLAFGLGMANALDMPARQSFFSEIVAQEHLPNAIMLNATVFNLARMIGPAIATVCIQAVGMASCFALNALSFVAVLIALIMMRIPLKTLPTKELSIRGTLADIRTALSYIRQTPKLFIPLLTFMWVNILTMNYTVSLALLSDSVLHKGVSGYSALTTSMGVGSVLAAILMTVFIRRAPQRRFITATAIATSVIFLILGLTANYLFACILLFLTGLTTILLITSVNSTLQMHSRKDMRGRVMGVYAFVMGGMTPIGGLFTGAVSEAFGISACILISGTLCLLLTAVCAVMDERSTATEAKSRKA